MSCLTRRFVSLRIQDDVKVQIEQHKLFITGCDKKGRPVLWLRTGAHIPMNDVKLVKKFIIYAFDAAIRVCDNKLNPLGKFIGILDLSELAYKNLDLSGASADSVAQG